MSLNIEQTDIREGEQAARTVEKRASRLYVWREAWTTGCLCGVSRGRSVREEGFCMRTARVRNRCEIDEVLRSINDVGISLMF